MRAFIVKWLVEWGN